ncbi:MAG TPA: hypothetical protein VJ860_08105 [Polyangia bacterium]|nr:hypothetical protein [Polyangia bacterium]
MPAVLDHVSALVTRPTSASDLPEQRKSVSVSGHGSVSDQRNAACVGDSRDGRAKRGAGGVGCPSRSPPGVSGTRIAFRIPRNAHELAHALAHATREPRPGLPSGRSLPPGRPRGLAARPC